MGLLTGLMVAFMVVQTSRSQEDDRGILYPQDTETRQKISLDGLWNFIQANSSDPLRGFTDHWYEKKFIEINNVDIRLMPVPASYNDITTDWKLRDHVGLVWYEKFFQVPKFWTNVGKIWLRFGSVSYAADVWLNGVKIMSHQIGHLPFETEITTFLKFGKENRLTVACDNTLLSSTIPQGKVEKLVSGRLSQVYTFDFFNYAGIDRSVFLYYTPSTYIEDITVVTEKIDVENDTQIALLGYEVVYVTELAENISCIFTLRDTTGKVIAREDNEQLKGQIKIENPNLWWPYLMHESPGYLYTFQVELFKKTGELVDTYSIKIGIRSLKWNSTSFTINNKPIYLHGFGRHEDSDIRGKGLDFPLIIRDHDLIKWVGANAYRTSHYPYAEEIMDLADSYGIMIIDECPGVNIEGFSKELLENHKKSLTELIKRDKNRPSVIMWSAANEPRTQFPAAKAYFEAVINHIRSLDTSRPTTIVEAQAPASTESSHFVDIVSFNRYNAWYSEAGNLDVVTEHVMSEATSWHQKFQKPVIMQEYGGDTMEGLHFEPAFIWSEEYQVSLMSNHFKAFDRLRSEGFFIGEFIWNFADFKTAQSYTRVGGNKKGIFTRNRQPKASAHFLRNRYWNLANNLYNASLPEDLYKYVAPNVVNKHTEL